MIIIYILWIRFGIIYYDCSLLSMSCVDGIECVPQFKSVHIDWLLHSSNIILFKITVLGLIG